MHRAGPDAYDVDLEVAVQPADSTSPTSVCHSNLRNIYWSFRQMLAHHTINGCNMRPGDLCGSGTISGPEPSSFGSMLELSWNGEKPLALDGGQKRCFLEDGDTVKMTAVARSGKLQVGFGECVGRIEPAL